MGTGINNDYRKIRIMKKTIVFVLLSLFCFGYCALIFSIQSGSNFYIIWAIGGLFFVGLAVMAHFDMWTRMPARLRHTAAIILIACVMLFLIVEGCIISAFGSKGEPNLDYIIVLGAQVKENGPSAALKFRLDEAYDYLVANENTICIVSGGQGYNEPYSEAQGMYDYLTERGIDGERIIMEDKSTDTSENIAYSAVFLDRENDRVGIVTNNFHVFRSVHLAKHQGIKHVCGIAADSNVIFQLNNMVREFFGIIKDLVFGNLI